MLIDNRTNLSLKEVFNMILAIIAKGDGGETFYYGKVDRYTIQRLEDKYKVEVHYLKRYVKWVIKECKRNG